MCVGSAIVQDTFNLLGKTVTYSQDIHIQALTEMEKTKFCCYFGLLRKNNNYSKDYQNKKVAINTPSLPLLTH